MIQEQINVGERNRLESYAYSILKTSINYLDFYRECFSHISFCKGYGIEFKKNEFNEKLLEIVSEPYPNLSRFVLVFRKNIIGFCHFYFEDAVVIASGGISPTLIDSGKGIMGAVIFYDFCFKKFSVNKIIVKIQKDNTKSIRVHKAIGFVRDYSNKQRIEMQLHKKKFPNAFSKSILSKIKYESK